MSAKSKRFPQRLNLRDGKVDMTHGSGGRVVDWLTGEQLPRIC
jgi:hypothetical protein